MFTDSFKYYKSKCPPPSFESVVNFGQNDDNLFTRRTIINAGEEFKHLGLTNPTHWHSYQFSSGLIFIKNPFTPHGQRYWIARCLRDYPKSPHANNLRSKCISPAAIDDWWTEMVSSRTKSDKESLRSALRWCTLGYHHQWDTKVYSEEMKHSFPVDLGTLSAYIARTLNFGEYSAEAAIVNFYPIGTTLAGHTDHSERNLDAPLFSFSFGQSAIFLIGGTTKDIKPTAMFLHSGDIVIMSKESRLCYHAVPRVFKSDDSVWNNTIDGGDDDDDDRNEMPKKRKIENKSGCLVKDLWNKVDDRFYWEPFNEYVENCRINVNVRQVLRKGEHSL
ncbi:hypothetical protein HA402_009874 [Bradysia odoriphaga]|nr:hypothetical protein HA402_009874 [Bradysia odoriphaga]